VLVSDAETAAALAVVRSLGRAGHRPSVLAWSPHAPAAASRHARSAFRLPDPEHDPDGWTDRLLGIVRGSGWDLFLPVTDTAMLLADRAREDLAPLVRLAMPPARTLSVLLDKTAVLDRAAAAGLPVLRGRPEDVPLPAVVKPVRSRALAYRAVRSATARIVGTRADLRAEAARLDRSGHGSYVEPWIPGEGRGIFLLRVAGRTPVRFAHRRIREASPLGGPSAVAVSVAADPELLAFSEVLADALEVDGPMMAEYRGRPGAWVLLEVNARFWGTLGLAVDAGADFPAAWVAAALGGQAEPGAAYRLGVRRRNLSFDLRRTLAILAGRPREIEIPWPGRVRAVVELLLGGAPGLFSRADDPAPARAQALHLLGRLLDRG
jgi:predicted ATP-grasp superfamily ATP-dependent carboligase